MTTIRIQRDGQDIVNQLILAVESTDRLVIDEVGEDYIVAKSSLIHYLYSYGVKIRVKVAATYTEEVELDFTASRRIPLNITARPDKYKYQLMNSLLSQDTTNLGALPPGDEYSNRNSSIFGLDIHGQDVLSTSQIRSLSTKAGAQAVLLIKFVTKNVIDIDKLKIEFDEPKTYIRISAEGIEEIEADLEDIFGQENINIRYTGQDGVEIELSQ